VRPARVPSVSMETRWTGRGVAGPGLAELRGGFKNVQVRGRASSPFHAEGRQSTGDEAVPFSCLNPPCRGNQTEADLRRGLLERPHSSRARESVCWCVPV
jgi:hypothetical protein